ncbi:MAG: alpha-1,4-glucan--maltose-1-phosphate maltosyltransferase [Planctomycetes bacterium]|jgi:starch synthase (maltosyl-transferring)|nr:alpha-1,4-glucan--maltose-1-phosphate maltosyltransferase [Planctomycetota bacterium]
MKDANWRVAISGVKPEIDAGRFSVKRVVGERVTVSADLVADGHEVVSGDLLWRRAGERRWHHVPLLALGNDRYEAAFTAEEPGGYEYTLRGYVDGFRTWRRDLEKRLNAGQDVGDDLLLGSEVVSRAAGRAGKAERSTLETAARRLRTPAADRLTFALSEELLALVAEWPDLEAATTYERTLRVVVDRERAAFSAWYEIFPRSTSPEPGRPGTFRDLIARLPYVAELGFDVVYLPPIHPIGRAFRKGKNNALEARPGEPGSPWAIGSAEGGHTAIDPGLGTIGDFRAVLARAKELGMEVALDLAFQCSPDHPLVREHPEWFRKRPDGSIQYAENPPKKYQDIYPLDFGTADRPGLWAALREIVVHWVREGVRIFRVDNPHTKSFAFWEWLISDVRASHPDVIFLSEAFTRPKLMYHLAKLGFTQSYTYFTWRESRIEFTDYLTELTQTEVAEFFRPNFWPNTPDILPKHLHGAGRGAFLSRLVLAATLSSSYGIYGPAFELLENVPREPGSEEYLDSEKYEVRCWDLDKRGSLRHEIALLNRIRRENPAFRRNRTLRFHGTSNEQILAFSKTDDDGRNAILVFVNLEPQYVHSCFSNLYLPALSLPWDRPFTVHDLIDDRRYTWQGPRNFVELNPSRFPAHVFRVEV